MTARNTHAFRSRFTQRMADPRDPSKGKDFPGTPRPGDPNDPTRRNPEDPHPRDPSRGTPMNDPDTNDPARREFPDPNPTRDPNQPERGGDKSLTARRSSRGGRAR